MSTRTAFRGKIAGVEYDDPALFEKAARGAGYTRRGRSGRAWKVGTEVRFVIDGTAVRGQVWSRADVDGWAWAAMDDGQFVAVHCGSATAHESIGGTTLGRVA